jgi:hypothetical protein
LDPVWFYLNGLLRLFWWSGFWSMFSPGIYYYTPMAILGGIMGHGMFIRGAWRDRLFWRETLPHWTILISFIAGLAWHAALFEIRTSMTGAERSGNGGWYLLVIAPSIFLILLLPAKWIWSEKGMHRLFQCLAFGMIAWNLLGRVSSYMFWSGGVHLHHFVRGMDFRETVAALFDLKNWNAFLSLPGIIHPVWLYSVVPLLVALAGSILLIRPNPLATKNLNALNATRLLPDQDS